MTWLWVPKHLAVSWHAILIDRYGGAPGLRDEGLLESALARPLNQAAYEPDVTTEELGAIYGVGIAKAHAFVDGNKRIAFAVMVSFLKAHGQRLDASEADATTIMLAVAEGTMDHAALAKWLSEHCRKASAEK